MRTTGDDRRPDDDHDKIKYRPYLYCRVSEHDDGRRSKVDLSLHWDMGLKGISQRARVIVKPEKPQNPVITVTNASPIPSEFCVVSFFLSSIKHPETYPRPGDTMQPLGAPHQVRVPGNGSVMVTGDAWTPKGGWFYAIYASLCDPIADPDTQENTDYLRRGRHFGEMEVMTDSKLKRVSPRKGAIVHFVSLDNQNESSVEYRLQSSLSAGLTTSNQEQADPWHFGFTTEPSTGAGAKGVKLPLFQELTLLVPPKSKKSVWFIARQGPRPRFASYRILVWKDGKINPTCSLRIPSP